MSQPTISPAISFIRSIVIPLLQQITTTTQNPGSVNPNTLAEIAAVLNTFSHPENIKGIVDSASTLKELSFENLLKSLGLKKEDLSGDPLKIIEKINIENEDTAKLLQKFLDTIEAAIKSSTEEQLNNMIIEVLDANIPGVPVSSSTYKFASKFGVGNVLSLAGKLAAIPPFVKGNSLKEILTNVWETFATPLKGKIQETLAAAEQKRREENEQKMRELQAKLAEQQKGLEGDVAKIGIQIQMCETAIKGQPDAAKELSELDEAIAKTKKSIEEDPRHKMALATQAKLKDISEKCTAIEKDPNNKELVKTLLKSIETAEKEEPKIIVPQEFRAHLEKALAEPSSPKAAETSPTPTKKGGFLTGVGYYASYLNPWSYGSSSTSKEPPKPSEVLPPSAPLVDQKQVAGLKTWTNEEFKKTEEVVEQHKKLLSDMGKMEAQSKGLKDLEQQKKDLQKKMGDLSALKDQQLKKLADMKASLQVLKDDVKKYDNAFIRFFGWLFQTKDYKIYTDVNKSLEEHQALVDDLGKVKISEAKQVTGETLKEQTTMASERQADLDKISDKIAKFGLLAGEKLGQTIAPKAPSNVEPPDEEVFHDTIDDRPDDDLNPPSRHQH